MIKKQRNTYKKFGWEPAHLGVNSSEETYRLSEQAAVELLPRKLSTFV